MHTPLLSCTATTTRNDKNEIIENLEMRGCVEVSASPNIFCEVKRRSNIEADMSHVLCDLRKNSIKAARVLVYCHSLDMCSQLFAHFNYEMGEASFYPPGAPHLSENRIYGIFHSGTSEHNKDVILNSLMVLLEWFLPQLPLAWELI